MAVDANGNVIEDADGLETADDGDDAAQVESPPVVEDEHGKKYVRYDTVQKTREANKALKAQVEELRKQIPQKPAAGAAAPAAAAAPQQTPAAAAAPSPESVALVERLDQLQASVASLAVKEAAADFLDAHPDVVPESDFAKAMHEEIVNGRGRGVALSLEDAYHIVKGKEAVKSGRDTNTSGDDESQHPNRKFFERPRSADGKFQGMKRREPDPFEAAKQRALQNFDQRR